MLHQFFNFLGVFIFILVYFTIFLGAFLKKIINPLVFVGYELIIASSAPRASLAIYHLMFNARSWKNRAGEKWGTGISFSFPFRFRRAASYLRESITSESQQLGVYGGLGGRVGTTLSLSIKRQKIQENTLRILGEVIFFQALSRNNFCWVHWQ